MKHGFKVWLIEYIDQELKKHPESKPALLRLLKPQSGEFEQFVRERLGGWALQFATQVNPGTVASLAVDPARDPQEFVQALREHLAQELIAVPEEPAVTQQSRPASPTFPEDRFELG